jgi:phosphatidylglycerophosphatase C
MRPKQSPKEINRETCYEFSCKVSVAAMKVLFFDFDKTLTKVDTLLLFAFFLSMQTKKIHKIIFVFYVFVLFRTKIIKNFCFKQIFAKILFSKMGSNLLLYYSDQFFKKYLNILKLDQSLKILQKNVAIGNKVYIVSSNFDIFLTPLTDRWKLNGIIATELEVIDNIVTGNLKSLPCDGLEKLRRVLQKIDIDSVKRADAYGDSKGDYDLLNFVENGYWVRRHKMWRHCHFAEFRKDNGNTQFR